MNRIDQPERAPAARGGKHKDDDECRTRQELQARLGRIRHKIVVLSGKGGVGKSTIAVNLAVALEAMGKRVGLLDVDIHGPSVPTLLGLERETVQGRGDELVPVDIGGLRVLSLGFFLANPDDAVIWRGPMKMNVIQQFLKDAVWGDLDYLIIDSPPGTGDEPLSVCQLVHGLDGAVIVTTPQRLAAVDVRKAVSFCRTLKVPVLGIVENMSGFVCPKCGEATPIFREGGGRRIAEGMDVPFLGCIPIDPEIAESCDRGQAFVHHHAESPTARIIKDIFAPIALLDQTDQSTRVVPHPVAGPLPELRAEPGKDDQMKVAIPLADGKLASHFGHCERFALLDVDAAENHIVGREDVEAPPHQPGLLPPWLAERGVNLIIAGGMGQRAVSLFAEQGIKVVVGAPVETPERLVSSLLAGTLQVGENVCDH